MIKFTLLLLFITLNTFGQTPEKIILETDKPYYLAGQEIQLQVNVYDAQQPQPTFLSIPLYVEWVDLKNKKILERWNMKLENGEAKLTFRTSEKLSSGYYQIRAYTNWMKNFYIPTQNILVLGTNYQSEIAEIQPDTNIQVFNKNTSLVADLINRIAVSVTNSFNAPLTTNILLTNSKNDSLMSFKTDTLGIGVLQFTPIMGENYHLKVGTKTINLAPIVTSGTVLISELQNGIAKIFIQNKITQEDSLTLVIQQRGQLINSFRISTKKPLIRLNIEDKELKSGILNINLFDSNSKLISEQMIFVKNTTDSVSVSWLLDTEVGEAIKTNDMLLINRQLQTKTNKLFSPDITEKAKIFEPESGLCIKGKVFLKKNAKPKKMNISLIIEEMESTEKQFHVTNVLPNGEFSFINLTFYGNNSGTLMATDNNQDVNILIDSVAIPPIDSPQIAIDWRPFVQQKEKLEEVRYATFEEILRLNKEKITTLDEVTVTAKKKIQNLNSMMDKAEPAQVIDLSKRPVSNPDFGPFFSQYIAYRMRKYPSSVTVKVFVDGTEIWDEPHNMFSIANVVIWEGTEAAVFGADIVVNLVSRPMNDTNRSNKQFDKLLIGYHKN